MNLISKLSLITLLFSLKCFAGRGLPSEYDSRDRENDPRGATHLNLDKVLEVVNKKRPRSIKKLIKKLSKIDPAYFSYFTLIKNSESLQGSSPMFPRVLLFGSDAKLLMTFNGDKKDRGFKTLEMIQFRSHPAPHFEFREIIQKGSKLRVSKKNPAKCMRCHTTDYLPRWAAYDRWPTAFGSFDDGVIGEEREEYKKFQSIQKKHPRYKYLNFLVDERTDVAPYCPRPGRSSLHLQYFRPNLLLTDILSINHAKVLVEIIKRNSNYDLEGPKLLSEFMRCGPGKKDFTPSSLKKFEIDPFHWNMGMEPTYEYSNNPYYFFLGSYYLRHMVQEFLHKDLEKKYPKLVTAKRWFDYKEARKYPVGDEESSLDEYRDKGEKPQNFDLEEITCRQLDKIIIKQSVTVKNSSRKAPGKIFDLCLSCHKEVTPEWQNLQSLPKKEIESIKAKIHSRIHSDDNDYHMPPDRKLSDFEKKQLLDFLEQI